MTARTSLAALTASALLAACGGSHTATRTDTGAVVAGPAPAAAARVAPQPPRVQALVTAETENRLLVVQLPTGRVLGSVPLPRDPEDIAGNSAGGDVVAVSSAAGKVTVLNGNTFEPLMVLGGFEEPHIAAIAPDGKHAYVTDDARGTLTAINLSTLRETSTIRVGAGAHHMCFDVKDQLAWVALGESARMLVLLSTKDLGHPRVVGHFPPPFLVHDLACSPDSGRVWMSSASGPDVTLFDGFDYGVVFRVPVGPPPQHVVLQGRYAYLTSGYGGVIEQVDATTGRILARAKSPYGSFELAADGRYVVTSSLLRGTLAIYTVGLKLVRVVHLAPATREVALSSPAGTRP